MSMKEIPITGWVVSSVAGILSCILLYEHLLYEIGCLPGWLVSMFISVAVFMLFSLLFGELADNRIFTRCDEFIWEHKVKAWGRDVKRKIDCVSKTTYKFK